MFLERNCLVSLYIFVIFCLLLNCFSLLLFSYQSSLICLFILYPSCPLLCLISPSICCINYLAGLAFFFVSSLIRIINVLALYSIKHFFVLCTVISFLSVSPLMLLIFRRFSLIICTRRFNVIIFCPLCVFFFPHTLY